MKNKRAGIKRLILTVCLTIVLLLLLSPIYTNMLSGFIDSRFNHVAEVQIIGNNIEILTAHTKNGSDIDETVKADGIILMPKIKSEWKTFFIRLVSKQAGTLTIVLTGPDKSGLGVSYPIIVDYKDFKIDGQIVMAEKTGLWSDNPYEYRLDLPKNGVTELEIKIRKYHFAQETMKKAYQFDFSLFFSTLVILFLLSYKVVQYVASFKLIEHNSRIDIVFVVVFIILTFVPMSRISYEQSSEKENRMLAEYPSLFVNHKFNIQYGTQFESWFNDRFFGRKTLIHLYDKIVMKINKYGKNSKAGIYKDDWLLNAGELQSETTPEELENINQGIQNFRNFCAKHNIKCYIEIIPRKLEFIRDKTFRIVPEDEQDKAQIIVDYVKKRQNYDIVYPLTEFHAANKTDMIFFKTDHHWTEWGAYVGYLALMKRIAADFPDIKAVRENDYNIFYKKEAKSDYDKILNVGSTCMLLRLKGKRCPLHTDYKYYNHKQETALKINRNDRLFTKDFYYPLARNKHKAMIIGNSFTENFASFSAYTFTNVMNRRCNNVFHDDMKLSRWKDEILKTGTDIIMIVINSEYSEHLQDLKD